MSADSSRNDVAPKPPREDIDLDGFPDGGPAPERAFRAHDKQWDPWFFSSARTGRFNLEEPNGTCYFAGDIETAVREYYGEWISDSNGITDARVKTLRVSTVFTPPNARYAHVSEQGVARYGVTSELTTMGDYAVPQQWAEAFKEHVHGLRYKARFSTGHDSWALFGASGPAPSLRHDPTAAVDGAAAVRAAGVRVVKTDSPPRASSLRIISDPPA